MYLTLIPWFNMKELPIASSSCDLALLTAASLYINNFCMSRNYTTGRPFVISNSTDLVFEKSDRKHDNNGRR
jgi:hypothetical protein